MSILVLAGDITRQTTDAIVNAANEACLGGGGVAGAIHRAGGKALDAACYALKEIRPNVRCPAGESRITIGGNLPCKYVIHTVGPDCSFGMAESKRKKLLTSAYASALDLAKDNGIKSISFPSIATGIYKYPLEEAAEIFARTATEFLQENPSMHIQMCIWDASPKRQDEMIRAYKSAVASASRAAVSIPVSSMPTKQCKSGTSEQHTLTAADCDFLSSASMTLAFIIQRINRQLSEKRPPKPGQTAYENFKAIDIDRLAELAKQDDTHQAKRLLDVYEEVVISEKSGWTRFVLQDEWSPEAYDITNPSLSTGLRNWGFSKEKIVSAKKYANQTKSVADVFPSVLTADILESFKQTANGSTKPHHGFVNGVHFIAKCARYTEPFGTSTDAHVHNEFLADRFLRSMGLNVPESREYQVDFHDGKGARTVRLSKFIENATPLNIAFMKSSGKEKRHIVEQVVSHYPVQSFIGGIDTYQNDNVLVDGYGELWYVDNGASFNFRAQGGLKSPSWFSRSDPNDLGYGYLSLFNFSSQMLLRSIVGSVDALIRSAKEVDFVAMADKLPAEIKTMAVLDYASLLKHFSIEVGQ